jgi:ABC-2 type transport system ATP-binding protein
MGGEGGGVLEIRALTKRFGALTAVDSLDLRVERGEIYAFLGPNGAGKTTTLRAAAGLLRPDSGEIRVAGHPVEPDALPFRRVLGYVPDRPYLYEKLTAWEFLQFVAGARGLRGWEARARDYLALFALEAWSHKLIEGFSHGMRQKLSLASSLLHGPPVLLVDEPMVGLDPRSARTVKDLFRHLAGEGAGLLLCTHSLEVAQELADRIGILHRGRLAAEGSFAELRERSTRPGSTLEEIFLQLTEEGDAGPEIGGSP